MITALLRRPQAEFMIIYVAVPLALAIIRPHSWIYTVLWFFALLAWRMLRQHYQISWREEWNMAALNKAELRRILKRFLPFAVALTFFTWIKIPQQLFLLPAQKPLVWVGVLVLYPLLSVFPQEIIYRSYYFRRYQNWPHDATQRFVLNCLVFGWVHIVLHNWVAVVFSTIGSAMFTQTYLRTRSLAAVCFEHALYGCYVFTVGLGYYFYHGMAVR